jgi:hypothetical protein
VVERLLTNYCKTGPSLTDKLEIQVLDDSTDDSMETRKNGELFTQKRFRHQTHRQNQPDWFASGASKEVD